MVEGRQRYDAEKLAAMCGVSLGGMGATSAAPTTTQVSTEEGLDILKRAFVDRQ